jgi:hypothetical protein
MLRVRTQSSALVAAHPEISDAQSVQSTLKVCRNYIW